MAPLRGERVTHKSPVGPISRLISTFAAPPLIGGHGAVLVPVGTHRRHCNAVPRTYLVARAGPFCRQARPQYRGAPPYSIFADPELLNTVLLVLSCVYEWGRGRMRA